jgi:hypothetical protein
MVLDQDSIPLADSPNPTDLDFLCESGSTVFTVGTRLTTAATVTPCQLASEVPPRIKPLVAPRPALAIPPGFLSRAAPIAAPRAAPSSTAVPHADLASFAAPAVVSDGPPPREWLASLIAYIHHPR